MKRSRSALILSALATVGCFSISDTSFDEVSRVSSPAGKMDAILVETNGGATTSFGYYVFVVPPGVKLTKRDEKYIVARLYGAIRNQGAYGANLRWSVKERLQIEYLRSKAAEVIEPTVNYDGVDVAVELRGGVEDPAAAPGGMLYNLEKTPK